MEPPLNMSSLPAPPSLQVFKPAMVVRSKPQEDGPIARRIMFDEVVRAKTWKVTEDHWRLGDIGRTGKNHRKTMGKP